ncbi:MAG TPA: hypothetical protein VFE90_17030 [Myxococcales bacterium]|nr:hypothetical protein [Myxococcales bacterium]
MALTIAVKSIQSLDDSTEWGADEPYVLVTGVDLSQLIPHVEVTLYGPWADVDKGETHQTGVFLPFWGLDNRTAVAIANPSSVIFVVSVMENDDGKPGALRTLVKAAAVASLAASNGMPRATRVQKLLADIHGALGIPTGAPNFDDIVGSKELVLTPPDLVRPPGGRRVKTLDFAGGDEGTFRVAVELAFV